MHSARPRTASDDTLSRAPRAWRRADLEARRHLLRLWLACEDAPPFPLAMTEQFQGLSHNGRPNGIHVEGVPLVAPLDASPSGADVRAAR